MMLSIVCPIYNEVRYIKGCIESIVAQDYPKDSLEVLFVDGMSLDGTQAMLYSNLCLYILSLNYWIILKKLLPLL